MPRISTSMTLEDHANAVAEAVYAAVVETNERAKERGEEHEIAATYHGLTMAFIRAFMTDEGGLPPPEQVEWFIEAFGTNARGMFEIIRAKVEAGNFQRRTN